MSAADDDRYGLDEIHAEAATLHFRRSPMVPTAWAVRCPCCEEMIEIDDTDVSEDGDTFSIDPVTGSQFVKCEKCGDLIEIVPVVVTRR